MTFIETVLLDYFPTSCPSGSSFANLYSTLLWFCWKTFDIEQLKLPGAVLLKLLPFHHLRSLNFADQSNLLKTHFPGYESFRLKKLIWSISNLDIYCCNLSHCSNRWPWNASFLKSPPVPVYLIFNLKLQQKIFWTLSDNLEKGEIEHMIKCNTRFVSSGKLILNWHFVSENCCFISKEQQGTSLQKLPMSHLRI